MIKPEHQMTIEILKLMIAFLTPIIILVLGLLINKTIERNKKSLLQEKEWQVRWAETFLIKAIKFEENISAMVTALFRLQQNRQTKSDAKKEDELLKTINESFANIQYLEWDIQNFAQFAQKNCKDLKDKQSELTDSIRDIFTQGQGDLEKIRTIQFEYNKLVRKAHNEILNTV